MANIVYTKSMSHKDIYYLFREFREEIVIDIRSGYIKASKKLSPDEYSFLLNELIN